MIELTWDGESAALGDFGRLGIVVPSSPPFPVEHVPDSI